MTTFAIGEQVRVARRTSRRGEFAGHLGRYGVLVEQYAPFDRWSVQFQDGVKAWYWGEELEGDKTGSWYLGTDPDDGAPIHGDHVTIRYL